MPVFEKTPQQRSKALSTRNQIKFQRNACDGVNGHELGKLRVHTNTQAHFSMSSDCFCHKNEFCSFSYARPDQKACHIIPYQIRATSNCNVITLCKSDPNCDGIYFDGGNYNAVRCASKGLIHIEEASDSHYLIQLRSC